MRLPLRHVLRSTVALSAIALGSGAASAACTTADGVVTCTGVDTTDSINAQVNSATPPSVTLAIAKDAIVVRGFSSQMSPSGVRFPGAVGYKNSGTVGTTLANVDFSYVGPTSSFNGVVNPANIFTFTNAGTQNGGIFAFNVGGAIAATNSGTVTRGIDLRNAGPISFSNSGTVYISDRFDFVNAITLLSSVTTSHAGFDGITRTTESGGPITAAIGGVVGRPATMTAAVETQNVFARSVGGVDVAVTGTAGVVQANSRGDLAASQFSIVRDTATTTITQFNENRTFGGNARVTVGTNGQLAEVRVTSGTGSATAIIDGSVDSGSNRNSSGVVTASAFGTESAGGATSVSSNSAPFLTNRTSNYTSISTGGTALVEVTATGRVAGAVGAASNAGSATVRVAGNVGIDTNFSSASAFSDQTNSAFQSRSVERADGSFEFVLNATETTSGGAALVTVAATGRVSGSLLAQGNGLATVDNAGRARGGAVATSNRLVTTERAENITRAIATSAAGVRTQVDRSATSFTEQSLGGTASVTNRIGGTIQAEVGADGVRGATLDNAGSVGGGVILRSIGARRDGVRTDQTTTTSTPAAGGGTSTTVVRDFNNTEATRATGGAVTGTYSGNVGSSPDSFSRVTQNGTTASTATVTGTLFADFFGTAGADNRDFVSSGSSRQVTQPSGTSTREQTSATRSVTTQITSTSSLVVGATGHITQSAFGVGSANVNSLGGDARFTLDGGRVDGGVSLQAGSGTNTTSSSDSASSFTRAASSSNTFTPEVQQSQTSKASFEQRAAVGTATVTINSGTIGGNLNVAGTGGGAGTIGASALINGTVTGDVSVRSNRNDISSSSDNHFIRTGAFTTSGTLTTRFATTPAASGGDVLITLNGDVGGFVEATAATGSATLNLNGLAGTERRAGVIANAFGFSRQTDTVQTFAGPDFFSQQMTSSRSVNSSVASGGKAIINIAANAAGASSVEGDVIVRGFSGSTLNIASGARLNQVAGGVFLGVALANSLTTSESRFSGSVQTGSTSTNVSTIVGGPTVLNNAGTIGSSTNPAVVNVFSVTSADANDSGTINGDLTARSRSANSVTTTTTSASRIVTRDQSAVGGAARVDNVGLVTGRVTAIGGTGLIANGGVIRGGVILGGGFSNFSTTTTTTAVGTNTSLSVPNPTLFNQSYTLNQNGLLLGGVNVTGATTLDPSGATVRTSNVNATVNLNDGSVMLGDITADANVVADVNLVGSGFLGVAADDRPLAATLGAAVTAFLPTVSITRFTGTDPALGTTTALSAGSRITAVRTVTKTGGGTFVLVGTPVRTDPDTSMPLYTLDLGALRVAGGELQLGTASNAGAFGARGNVENAATLVLGRRISSGTLTAVQGINMSVLGNFTNAPSGTLVVGANPTFVRAGGALTPFALGSPGLASTPSFVRVDGNLTLIGALAVQIVPGSLYDTGRLYDLFNVSGTFSNIGTVHSGFEPPFLSFVLTPRSEGGRTVVSLDAQRANFDTVATDGNAAAAAGALQAALPGIFGGLRTVGGGGALNQHFAGIVSLLDTQSTPDQAAQVFRDLSSGEVYGSLSALSTTVPFGDAIDGLSPTGKRDGIGLWFRPTGQFSKYHRNRASGASELNASNYGGSIGLNFATGEGGHIGIAGGYGKIDADSEATERAEADTYMVGIYGAQQFGRLHASAQAVYGKSEWDVLRDLPSLSRTAKGSFGGDQIRATLRVAYTITLIPGLDISPFAKVEARRYKFDGFEETGAGAVSLAVSQRAKTVVTPEVGVRMAGSLGATLRPFAEASYIFQGDVGTTPRMSFLGNRETEFSVQGVDPDDGIKGAIGVAADIGRGVIFIRGDYRTGGDQQVGSVRGGLLFRF